jgi:hypothetical protein
MEWAVRGFATPVALDASPEVIARAIHELLDSQSSAQAVTLPSWSDVADALKRLYRVGLSPMSKRAVG